MVQESHIADILDKEPMAGTTDASLEEKRKKVGNYVILKTIGEGSTLGHSSDHRNESESIRHSSVRHMRVHPFLNWKGTSSFSSLGGSESDQ
jgi:hypothetical protein